ncbi:hypothetical protein EVAR_5977_1 [Eumeta japonica]|uniref:Uncharacterized protein n=1 Tax=Eumeta variegata TaxID=151549 RepID=A0A4C1TCK6_EUMVA|nr:hypothetical protein EVAR_5977_1 [Eumeta japonica]
MDTAKCKYSRMKQFSPEKEVLTANSKPVTNHTCPRMSRENAPYRTQIASITGCYETDQSCRSARLVFAQATLYCIRPAATFRRDAACEPLAGLGVTVAVTSLSFTPMTSSPANRGRYRAHAR